MSASGEGAKGSQSHLVDPLGPCPACGIPLDGERHCKVCGFDVPDPRLGTIVAEKYRIDAVLGEGGIGVVYRAFHLTLGEGVAIKFLRHPLSERSEFRARFRREAVILAGLRHPAIVSVLEFGELDGELYMVMELIAGTPFSNVIQTNGVPMPWIRVGPVFDEILGVLEAAHAAGIVHGDLKPENVMLLDATERGGRVKVLDFGIAHFEEAGTGGQRPSETDPIRGTPLYMSPEQCKGVHVTAASDIYSAGVMLFEAVTGVLPFDALDHAGMMFRHMFVEPPRLAISGVRPAASRGLEDLVQRAMAKSPATRPNARAFREELARVVRGTDA